MNNNSKPSTTQSEDFISGKIALKDDSKCIDCGKCLEVCRFNAISQDFSIIERRCEGCGVCAWMCPEKAITMEDQNTGMLYESTTRYGPMFHARLDIGGEISDKLVTAVIQRAHEKASQLKKELVIVDGSPGIGCPVIAALTNATLVLLVVEPTTTAIHDMKRTIELAAHFKLPVSIMVNKSTINEE
jgi:MinD superfamily P-loop ATPase